MIDTGILTEANIKRFISLVMSRFAGKSLKLLFQATIHGFAAAEFHKKCDGKQPTVVLIKAANNRTFGGVTALTWEGNGYKGKDASAFLFSLDNNSTHQCINQEKVICCSPSYGPIFGGGNDILISSNCN